MMKKFEKLSLDKFKNQELSDISRLFGGSMPGLTANICTKQSDPNDTGHADPPVKDAPL